MFDFIHASGQNSILQELSILGAMEETRQKIKDQLLHLLKMRGAQTAVELSRHLQVSPMAIRQHLQSLRAEGWVDYREEKRPMGRPVKLWQLTQQATPHFPDRHADLTLDLLRGVETLFGSGGLEQLMVERVRRQTQQYCEQMAALGIGENWRDRTRAIAQLRTQEGYMAEVFSPAEDTLLLVENHCPVYAAAQTCQGLCGAEIAVFRSILGETVTVERVEHMLGGDRRCAYRVQTRSPAAADSN